MGKLENIQNYYKKKYYEKKQKEREEDLENSLFKHSFEYKDNCDKAFHNCFTRHPNFKGFIKDFRERMESLFEDGMTWENYPEWEIDHVKPLAKGGKHEVNNLQPLWMSENRSKKDKF